ncbi:metal-dependent transcriptional regulator [Candidatus Thorarchaeota archaeon]|jgi:DtxR family Mn-dependent transcriptional regulator|nr:MAG: metal-dependent transcriptional regulator [Candidatus Thorarchaeota archaeon]
MTERGCKKDPQTQYELTKALEEYIKVIHDLELRSGSAAAKEVAERLGVKAPSVTAALHKLDSLGMVEYKPYQEVKLTEKGRQVAEKLDWRHKTLMDFLLLIGVNEEVAKTDACEIEHIVHRETIEKLSSYLQAVEN